MVLLGGVACTAGDGGRIGGWHEAALPPLVVAIDTSAERDLLLDCLRRIVAPPVRFAALIERDRHHVLVVVAPAQFAVVRLRPAGQVQASDTVAFVPDRHDGVRIGTAILAAAPGRWVPNRATDGTVWPGDTIGHIEEPDHWLAIGTVEAGEAEQIHAGDPARLRLGRKAAAVLRGRVEEVRHAGNDPRSGADVSVDFLHRGDEFTVGSSAEVTVMPTGPGDSVLAAPRAALTRLTAGSAVFIRKAAGEYEVRFGVAVASVGELVVLRSSVDRRARIVVGNSRLLVRVAEESLAARMRRMP
jgi:hypothetical protein